MGPGFLIFVAVAVFVGLPLLAIAVALGLWLQRSKRSAAFRTWCVAALSGACAYFAFLAAAAQLIRIIVREQRSPGYFEAHPALPLLLILFGLLTLFASFVCAVFSAWTAWRVVQAPATASA